MSKGEEDSPTASFLAKNVVFLAFHVSNRVKSAPWVIDVIDITSESCVLILESSLFISHVSPPIEAYKKRNLAKNSSS
jgi:hypothetical protein